MVKFKKENYKGFVIDFRRDVWGWVEAVGYKYRNKDTKRQEYAVVRSDGYKTKADAFSEVKKMIDNNQYRYASSGLSKASWLRD